jgi:hypothetical protein
MSFRSKYWWLRSSSRSDKLVSASLRKTERSAIEEPSVVSPRLGTSRRLDTLVNAGAAEAIVPSRTPGWGGVRYWISVCAAMVSLALAAAAQASLIVAPSIGGRNSALAGSDVATPEDGPGILLSNPAGAVGQTGTRVNTSLFAVFFDGHDSNPDIDYDTKSSETPIGVSGNYDLSGGVAGISIIYRLD